MGTTIGDYTEYAEEAAGNHREFDSFAWFDRPDDDENWCIVYTDNRDSCSLDRANAQAIREALAEYLDGDDIREESHNHWAVGYVNGYAIRVYDSEGQITPVFRAWCDLKAALDDYPVLDEETLSRIESEDESEAWDSWVSRDFERQLEREFDVDCFNFAGDELRELFDKLADRAHEYWEHHSDGPHIDVESIVSEAQCDDVRQFVPVKRIRIYRDGYPYVDGSLHLDELSCDMPIYSDEFYACMAADDLGESSATIDGYVYTWTID